MKKTIIFFFLILFFSNSAYSSSCESEFQKKEARTELDPRTKLDHILKDKLKGILKIALESDKLSFEERVVLAVSVGNNQIKEELRTYVLQIIAKDVPPHEQGFMLESLGRIEEEIRAFILKGLLRRNPEPELQEIIAKSAGEIGGEWGASVLKEMLKKYLSPFNLLPLTQDSITKSAVKIGGELGKGIYKDMLIKGVYKDLFEKDMPLEVQASIAEFAGENNMKEELIAKVLANLDNQGFSSQVRDFIAESLGRIGEELRVYILKALLKKNPEPYVQVIIARSAR